MRKRSARCGDARRLRLATHTSNRAAGCVGPSPRRSQGPASVCNFASALSPCATTPRSTWPQPSQSSALALSTPAPSSPHEFCLRKSRGRRAFGSLQRMRAITTTSARFVGYRQCFGCPLGLTESAASRARRRQTWQSRNYYAPRSVTLEESARDHARHTHRQLNSSKSGQTCLCKLRQWVARGLVLSAVSTGTGCEGLASSSGPRVKKALRGRRQLFVTA